MRNCDHGPCKADATIEINDKLLCLQHAREALRALPPKAALKEFKKEAPKRVFRKKDD